MRKEKRLGTGGENDWIIDFEKAGDTEWACRGGGQVRGRVGL